MDTNHVERPRHGSISLGFLLAWAWIVSYGLIANLVSTADDFATQYFILPSFGLLALLAVFALMGRRRSVMGALIGTGSIAVLALSLLIFFVPARC